MCTCKCNCHNSNFDRARKDYHLGCKKPADKEMKERCYYCANMCATLHVT